MLKDIIKLGKVTVFNNNEEINFPEVTNKLYEILDNSYLAPCLAMADSTSLEIERKKGIWIEITFEDIKSYKDFEFEKLLINLYPKHDFLVLHRFLDEKYQGKSITINLSYKTTELYKNIKKLAEGINNEK